MNRLFPIWISLRSNRELRFSDGGRVNTYPPMTYTTSPGRNLPIANSPRPQIGLLRISALGETYEFKRVRTIRSMFGKYAAMFPGLSLVRRSARTNRPPVLSALTVVSQLHLDASRSVAIPNKSGVARDFLQLNASAMTPWNCGLLRQQLCLSPGKPLKHRREVLGLREARDAESGGVPNFKLAKVKTNTMQLQWR